MALNISWILEWHDTMREIDELGAAYLTIINHNFFNPDVTVPSTEYALLWLARNKYLDVQVDLVRDLFWHNLSGRY